MNENYNNIIATLKEQIKKQINLKVMEFEKLKEQADIIYSQLCQLQTLETKIEEWEEVRRHYRLRSKLDKFKNEIL